MAAPPPPPKRGQLKLRPDLAQAAARSLESRKAIKDVMRRTRAPFLVTQRMSPKDLKELEESLKSLEKQLLERERQVSELEVKLGERERDIWESEALLKAKEKVVSDRLAQLKEFEAASQPSIGPADPSDPKAATTGANGSELPESLAEWKAQLEQQEANLRSAREQIKEREAFLEEAENTLFEKTIEQQEREAELEQRAEELEQLRACLDSETN